MLLAPFRFFLGSESTSPSVCAIRIHLYVCVCACDLFEGATCLMVFSLEPNRKSTIWGVRILQTNLATHVSKWGGAGTPKCFCFCSFWLPFSPPPHQKNTTAPKNQSHRCLFLCGFPFFASPKPRGTPEKLKKRAKQRLRGERPHAELQLQLRGCERLPRGGGRGL